jgi:hypothetical protein
MRFETKFWRTVAGLVLFAIGFGYVEAAVVADLRSIYVPLELTSIRRFPLASCFPCSPSRSLPRPPGAEKSGRVN